MDKVEIWVAMLVALSVANERLVEIVKSLIPPLSKTQEPGTEAEYWKNLGLHVLSIVCGIVTVYLCGQAVSDAFRESLFGAARFDKVQILAVGVLVGAGSGFWNSVAGYVLAVKKVRGSKAEESVADALQKQRERLAATSAPGQTLTESRGHA